MLGLYWDNGKENRKYYFQLQSASIIRLDDAQLRDLGHRTVELRLEPAVTSCWGFPSPEALWKVYIGGCQNYGPFSGTLNIGCRIIPGIQKGTIILTTTHINQPL